MAGIGFRLQRLLKEESYSSLVKAYLYSAIISTGPMLLAIIVMAAVGYFLKFQLGREEGEYFLGFVLYVYAFSMISIGIFLYVVTRYLADLLYWNRMDAVTPTYLSVLEVTFSLQALTALLYLFPLSLDPSVKLCLFSLYLFVSGIWIAMSFLSAAKSYLWIVLAFLLGGLAAVLSIYFLGNALGFHGYLVGFTLGQGIIFFILSARIFREFGYQRSHDFGFLLYFKRHPALALTGLFYYLGIWIDKMIFWFSSSGSRIAERLSVNFDYDLPMFLSFMTIVPSMAFFLIEMETSFYRHYRAYYDDVRDRADLATLQERQEGIRRNLTEHFQKFVLFQGILSGFVILFVFQIADLFHLNPAQMGIFRIGVLGAFLLMGFLMVVTILFYFDAQREVLGLTILYCLSNGLLTFLTLTIGLPAYGFGNAAASFLSLMIGFFLLDYRVKTLPFWTFMRQPILLPKYQFESESRS
ncbi:MAG: exopolysaccharide Pel transporter PelG [Deltaproteobacteria bacterium]|nr:exopolysaccharide Pel transporter PelG [Deltaproteobacteria bacterium]